MVSFVLSGVYLKQADIKILCNQYETRPDMKWGWLHNNIIIGRGITNGLKQTKKEYTISLEIRRYIIKLENQYQRQKKTTIARK